MLHSQQLLHDNRTLHSVGVALLEAVQHGGSRLAACAPSCSESRVRGVLEFDKGDLQISINSCLPVLGSADTSPASYRYTAEGPIEKGGPDLGSKHGPQVRSLPQV